MKNYNEKREMNNANGQIIRKDVKGSFVEVIAPSDDFQQITVNFISLDNNFKQTGKISIYFDIPEFLAFCTRITNRELRIAIEGDKKRCAAGNVAYAYEKADNGKIQYSGMKLSPDMTKDPKGLYSMAMLRGTKRDGAVISKQFWMCSSERADIVLNVCEGPGKEDAKGLISPAGKPTTTIRVPLSWGALEEIAEATRMRLYALETLYAVRGDFKRYGEKGATKQENTPRVEEKKQEVKNNAPAPTPTLAPAPTPEPTFEPASNMDIPDIPDIDFGADLDLNFDEPAPAPKQETANNDAHTVTGKFTSDFQALKGCYVANMNIKGTDYTIYFREVPDALKKAQEMGSEVSINIYYNNGNFAFDSLI